MQVQGEVQVTAKNGTGFKVNEQWYNIPAGGELPNRGDQVTFFAVQAGRGIEAQNLQVTQAAPPRQQGGFKKPGGGGGWNKQREPRDIYGPIVGHNLLIAATIKGAGCSVQDLISTAWEIMQASEQMVNQVIQQKAGQPQQAPQAQAQAAPPPPQPQAQPQAFQPPQAPQQPQPQPQPAPANGFIEDDLPWG